MLKVGITGGIASGKSTISKLFHDKGIGIVDADIISHQLMQNGQPAYVQAVDHFGNSILDDELNIKRKDLRRLVFEDSTQRAWLDQMIHPLIRQKAQSKLKTFSSDPYAILVVPLLFETGYDEIVDHILVIDCPVDVQIQRLMHRDGIDETLAWKMISAQMTNEDRITRADSIIKNDGNNDLVRAVSELDNIFRKTSLKHQ